MPEAAIYKHRHFLISKGEIRRARQSAVIRNVIDKPLVASAAASVASAADPIDLLAFIEACIAELEGGLVFGSFGQSFIKLTCRFARFDGIVSLSAILHHRIEAYLSENQEFQSTPSIDNALAGRSDEIRSLSIKSKPGVTLSHSSPGGTT